MGAIKQLLSAPLFVAELADKINELVLTANKVEGLKAGTGILLTVSEGGIVISTDETGSTVVPVGAAGDILYNDGSGWVMLVAPTISVADPVLRHNGTAPYWEEPESC